MKKKWLSWSLVGIMALTACSHTIDKKEETLSKTEVSDSQKQHVSNSLDFKSLYPNEEIRDYAKKMIGAKAPEFELKNLKGETISLQKLKGQNVIVEIALTTCPACIEAFPKVESFKSLSKGQVKVLTVFPNETKKAVEDFFKVNGYKKDDEIIAGEGMNSVVMDYQIKYTPTFIFIDKEGYIQFIHVGGDIDDVQLSQMSDLAFKTQLSSHFNQTKEVSTPQIPLHENSKP